MEPKVVDLGNHVRIMANTVKNWALELHKLSDQLIRDPVVQTDSAEREELRRKWSQTFFGKYFSVAN